MRWRSKLLAAFLVLAPFALAADSIPPTTYFNGATNLGASFQLNCGGTGLSCAKSGGKVTISTSGASCSTTTCAASALFRDDAGNDLAPIFAVQNHDGSHNHVTCQSGAGNGCVNNSPTGSGKLFCNDTTGCGLQYGSGQIYTDSGAHLIGSFVDLYSYITTNYLRLIADDFSPNAAGVISFGVARPIGPITSGVVTSDRSATGSTGVVQCDDSAGTDAIAMIGGSGNNGYLRWTPYDVSLYRSGPNAITVGTGSNSGTADLTAATITGTSFVGTHSEFYLSAYNAANLGAATKMRTFVVTNASTIATDAGTGFTSDIAGSTSGNLVARLCSDGTTCSGTNLKITYTVACTSAAGTETAATVNNAAVAAATTLTLAVSTACNTSDPGGNFGAHLTTP